MRFPRPLGVLAALLFAALALTGCMKLDMRLTIDASDDTVDGTMVVAMQKSVLALSGQDPAKAFGNVKGQLNGLPEGSREEPYDEGDYYGRKIIFEHVKLSDFSKGDLGLSHVDEQYRFQLKMSSGDLGALGADTKILSQVKIKIAITFPGKVIEHNGELSGKTVTWDTNAAEAKTLKAVSAEPNPLTWIVYAVGGGLIAIALIGGVIALAVRMTRKPEHADAEPALVAGGAPTVAPSLPPNLPEGR